MIIQGICTVSKTPSFTRNLFGSVTDIAGRTLTVLERNESGDCLSLLPDESNLVDVDHRDVVGFIPSQPSVISILSELLK